MADQAEIQEKLRALKDAYAAQLPEKMNQLMLAWGQWQTSQGSPAWDEESFQTLYRSVHSLSGSGKTFGFAALGDAARKLETYLVPIAEAKIALSSDQLDRIKRSLDEIHQASFLQNGTIAGQPHLIAIAPNNSGHRVSQRIFIVEDDREIAKDMEAQLGYFGYESNIFRNTDDFRNAMQSDPNVIVLMDVSFPGNDRGGIHVMKELQQGREVPIPLMFLSSHSEMEIRLEAVRAGCVAYLNKPVDFGALVDMLDKLTSAHEPDAYRVLIVDDETHLTNYYAETLKQAGMMVNVVNNPLMALKPMFEFAPDLILIDMYMPGCNGMELAQVIRQINAFVSIPIVFLSGETNQDKQLSALSMGGDDFLTKPIEAQHLVSAVANRIKRSTVLRSYMVRDSLTGLLNHTAIKDQLNHELARARRQGKPLSFAMIDIDSFKQVNDNYGHPVGDKVIKSLSRLLKQRLREADMVGRYGGEEFAVILTDTGGLAALGLMDSIREDFSKLQHQANGAGFFCTFSCGITATTQLSDSNRMCEATDKQLYLAKHTGRNRVMLAGAG